VSCLFTQNDVTFTDCRNSDRKNQNDGEVSFGLQTSNASGDRKSNACLDGCPSECPLGWKLIDKISDEKIIR